VNHTGIDHDGTISHGSYCLNASAQAMNGAPAYYTPCERAAAGGAPIKAQVWSFDEKKGGLLRMCLELNNKDLQTADTWKCLGPNQRNEQWRLGSDGTLRVQPLGGGAEKSVSWYRRLCADSPTVASTRIDGAASGAAGIPF
jgi:hypothetical protein